MTEADGSPRPAGGRPEHPSRGLAELRLRAEACLRGDRNQDLLDLVPELRADHEWWCHLWAPGAAVAARRIGAEVALELLEEAVASGFSQPELFDGELEKLFGEEATWPALHRRMSANVPLPQLELTDWPDPGPQLPLVLYSIAAERLDLLLTRLPPPEASAWQTTVRLLDWVHHSWRHANDHVDEPDAVTVLERVDAGERFACVEYSIVLSQALNALRIPARRVDLRQPAHHVGVGRGHVVSEAWIDDLDRWVLLDGQNGAYWTDTDGQPLGLHELLKLDAPPRLVRAGSSEVFPPGQAAAWFTYFTSATTTGYTWTSAPFAPVFQGMRVIQTPRLVRDGAAVHPQLSVVATGLAGTVERPVVRFQHFHPYGEGIRLHLGDGPVDADEWALDLTPGEHELAVAVVTPYGEAAPQRFAYLVREPGQLLDHGPVV
ncbi:transglutaminase domain protein [Kribbella flavida DSM 17836]|uniref:Transglutaminase domain protein n=1 Tax=Kribbella flavida (strain DSM 17836 / JCM 10339 / NBRC 14399) TaxID=479435 RepID=D2Q3Y0_KRIFD|nr:transglutaminase domain-containing protein [Kribbella flavida]ADB36002.1 transglutaminase domain protein [Kribbella flavida DSM 17836]